MSVLIVELLADRPDLVAAVGELRWQEWGHPPEPVDLAWWVATTAREAGRDGLPVTFVAVDGQGRVVGAVGMGATDPEERREFSPWVLGMVVRPDRRGSGVGRVLVARLMEFAAGRGDAEVWVATGRAAGFYQRCGWRAVERLRLASGQWVDVLRRPVS